MSKQSFLTDKFSQKGAAYLFLVLFILLAIFIGVYLVSIRTNLFPKAALGELTDKVGVNLGLGAFTPVTDQALEQVKKTGIGWIRLNCSWKNVEKKNDQWSFESCDELINQATSIGYKILMLLSTSNSWCRDGNKFTLEADAPCRDNSYKEYKDYIKHMVARYGKNAANLGEGYGQNKVSHFEIGNEPDINRSFSIRAGLYAEVLQNAYLIIKELDSESKVLLGGLSLPSPQSSESKQSFLSDKQSFLSDKQSFSANKDPDFLNKLLSDARFPSGKYFDIISIHHFGASDSATRKLNYVKEKLINFKVTKPIWVTEMGWSADEASQFIHKYQGGEEGQAKYLKDFISFYLQNGVEKVFWHTAFDLPSQKDSFCKHGLLFINGKQCLGENSKLESSDVLIPKKALNAMQDLILTPIIPSLSPSPTPSTTPLGSTVSSATPSATITPSPSPTPTPDTIDDYYTYEQQLENESEERNSPDEEEAVQQEEEPIPTPQETEQVEQPSTTEPEEIPTPSTQEISKPRGPASLPFSPVLITPSQTLQPFSYSETPNNKASPVERVVNVFQGISKTINNFIQYIFNAIPPLF